MRLRHVYFAITAALVVLYTAFVRDYDHITQLQVGFATLVVVLGALPTVVSMSNSREAGLMPLMPMHGLFYSVSFGLPVFSSKTVWRVADPNTLDDALLLTILGLLCLYSGYYGSRVLMVKLQPSQLLAAVSQRVQIRIGWVLFSLFLVFQNIPNFNSIPSLGQIQTPLGYLSLGILTLLALDNALSKTNKLFLAIAILFTLLTKTLSGSLAQAVFFVLFLGIIYWRKKRAIPWKYILVSILLAILLNPIKFEYRALTWYTQTDAQSFFQKTQLLGHIVQEYYSAGGILSTLDKDESTVNRLAHISIFNYVIHMTPDYVPYWFGDSYQTLWTSFIPRILWPDKPMATIGQDFGHRYYLLGDHDKTTSMNLPWLPEFYANFGFYGVLAGMFAIGVLFRALVQKFSFPVDLNIENALGVTITFSLFYAESNFSLMVGGLFLTYLVFVVLLRLLTRGFRTR